MNERYLVIIYLDGGEFCEEHLKEITEKDLFSFFSKTIISIGYLANFSIELKCYDTNNSVAPFGVDDIKKVAHFIFVKEINKELRKEV